ncbi:Eukaryotic translation initiation factor 3 subunit K [Rhizoctonia solani]|uniref:Eukaryotic translation initiation factor 3 subunit K n=1 Tax=Rhizoctonia solani TaxID=456999 RepID=A0A8H7IKD0_9AGAM|nr:Eukaryotic translation initiation factor 3 subunit K [Rhizoctonia solani]
MADAVAVFSEGTFEEQIQELVNYLARGLADDSRTAYIRPFQDALLTPEGQTPLSQDAGRKKKVIGMTREKVVGLGEGSDRDLGVGAHVTALVDAVLGAPETFTGIKYRVLSNLFNSLPRSSPLRQHVYRALLNMASNEGDLEVLQVNRTDVNRWLSEWNISDQDKSAFLDAVAEAFRKAETLIRHTVPTCLPPLGFCFVSKALEASTRVISSAVSEPSIFELGSLLRVDTLQAAKDHPLFALLRVFTSGDLAQFHEWEAKHASTLSEFGK